ncbi:MAG: inorganic phosphate transporter, partial [Alistipes sp.]
TTRAMGIVSAILLSVVIAFTIGTLLMYISRMIFSFRYMALFRRFGAMWCAASLTTIIYFAVFKGLQNALIDNPFINLIDRHMMLSLLICWVGCSVLLFILQRLKISILRITILSGTFALALAFAGNDLVNFIGVPVAGFDAYAIARQTGDTAMMMGMLNDNVPANFGILLFAGGVMILTLWTSKKAMHVTETEISLSTQNDEGPQLYGSSAFSRTIVRAALNVNSGFGRIFPQRMSDAVARRFEFEDVEHSGAPYDMIRATVNLTTSALLISLATSLKLPLSTTYVCFMVAMGSSLADRAWGRESAVYRITGVMAVITGWFVTALGGFVIALGVTLLLLWGGWIAAVILTALCALLLIHSHRKSPEERQEATHPKSIITEAESTDDVLYGCVEEVCTTMEQVTKIYNRTLVAVFKENRKVLREMVAHSDELFEQARTRKYNIMITLRRMQNCDIGTGHFYVQVVDYLSEVTKALIHITRPAFEHIDNNHEGLTKAQIVDLMRVNDE